MRIRRHAAVTAAALVLAVTGCGSSAPAPGGGGSSGGGGEQPYIAIVSKGFQHQFWQAVKKGAEQEAQKQGVRISFEGPATEADVEAQVTMLTNALGKQPAAIGFAALDSRAAAPLLQQAKTQQHPGHRLRLRGRQRHPADHGGHRQQGGRRRGGQAHVRGPRRHRQGRPGRARPDQQVRHRPPRRVHRVDEANAPGIQLLEPQYGGGDQAKSADITKSILSANPDLKGIYGSNEGSAIGVVKGVQESGRQGVTIVGFDSGKAQIDAIRSGAMLGAITQNPVGMGEQLVAAAVKAIKGESLPKVIDTGFYWYDKNNIDAPEIAAVLYQ